jgi:amidase
MADMLEVLDVIVVDDPSARGDFWRSQPWIALPRASEVRPPSYPPLRPASRADARQVLAGRRFGVPRMYINADPDAGTARTPGIGGPTGQRIETRPSVLALFEAARRDLEAAGAAVVDVDFPVITN